MLVEPDVQYKFLHNTAKEHLDNLRDVISAIQEQQVAAQVLASFSDSSSLVASTAMPTGSKNINPAIVSSELMPPPPKPSHSSARKRKAR